MEYREKGHNVKDLAALLSNFLDESIFSDMVACKESITKIAESNKFLTIVVYDVKPVALFIGYTYDHPIFKGKLLSGDLLLYVEPSHRGGLIAAKLVKKYTKWAEDKGVNYIQIGQSTGVGNIERVSKFYESQGFKTVGFNTLKEV